MLLYDKKVENFLESLLLSETEKNLYLAGLVKPEITVSELVHKTGINRTTAYHALGTLRQKNLALEVKIDGKLVYAMTKPIDLINVLNRKSTELEKQKQELASIVDLFPIPTEAVKTDTKIEKYEGIEGVKNAIEKALYCKSGCWEIIAPKDNFFSQVDKSYARYFMNTRKSHEIKTRSLWESTFNSPSKLTMEDLLMRKPRYLPKDFNGKFKSVIIIFDNKALFITSIKGQSAILVESGEISETLSVIFEALWSLSVKP